MDEKECISCHKIKLLKSFDVRNDGGNITYRNQCKECRRKYWLDWEEKHKNQRKKSHHEYYINNIEHCKLQQREYTQKLRLQILVHYGGNPPKCACCGEPEPKFLTIDHINGGGSKHRRGPKAPFKCSTLYYRWIIKNNYPNIFQILCMNCNFAKGMYGKCPHQTM
jgi:hypothetical protein